MWAGNCTINLASSNLTTPVGNPKALVLSLNIAFPDQDFYSTNDQNPSADFVGPHEVYAWGVTSASTGGLNTGQVDLGSMVVSQGQDFTLSLSPAGPIAIPTNSTLNLTLTATGVNGFSGNISLTTQLQQFIGNCLFISYEPSVIAANTQATIVLLNAGCQGIATAELHVQGTALGISRSSSNSPLLVNSNPNSDFTVGVGAPTSSTLTTQGSVTYPVTVTSLNGQSGAVTLTLASNPPAGVSCYLSSGTVYLSGSNSTGTSSLTCYGSTVTPGASYALQINASGPSGSHTANVPLSTQVTTFQVTSVTGSGIVHNDGQEVQVTHTVPLSNAPAYTSCTSPDPNVACRIISSSSNTVTLGITANPGTLHGTRSVTLNGGQSSVHAAIVDISPPELYSIGPSSIREGTTVSNGVITGYGFGDCFGDGECGGPEVLVDGPGDLRITPRGLITNLSIPVEMYAPIGSAGDYNVSLNLCDGSYDPQHFNLLPVDCILAPLLFTVAAAPAPQPPTVQITSRPITISQSSTPGQYTATLTSNASPPGGVYTWSTNNASMVGFDQSTPSTGPSADHVKLV